MMFGSTGSGEGETVMEDETRIELEAAAFRRLLAHLDGRKDVQNIELMNLAGFCRNCLSKWLVAEAESRDVPLDYDSARAWVYGMPYGEWKSKHQRPASSEDLARFESR